MTQPEHPSGARIQPALALRTWAGAWVIVNLAAGLIGSAATDGPDDDPAIWVLFVVQALGAAVYTGALWLASRRKHGLASGQHHAPVPAPTAAELASDYRVRFAPIDLLAVPLGVFTQLALVPLLYLPLREIWPATFNDDSLTETAKDLVDRAGGASMVALVAMVCVLAPLVEELVYRGLVQGGLVNGGLAPLLAVGLTAALFALVHFRPVEFPGLLLAGLVFGACLAVTGRLAPAILCHLAFNVTGLAFAL